VGAVEQAGAQALTVRVTPRESRGDRGVFRIRLIYVNRKLQRVCIIIA
jgi:hypothetical protein